MSGYWPSISLSHSKGPSSLRVAKKKINMLFCISTNETRYEERNFQPQMFIHYTNQQSLILRLFPVRTWNEINSKKLKQLNGVFPAPSCIPKVFFKDIFWENGTCGNQINFVTFMILWWFFILFLCIDKKLSNLAIFNSVIQKTKTA